jgi:hypothetical protein
MQRWSTWRSIRTWWNNSLVRSEEHLTAGVEFKKDRSMDYCIATTPLAHKHAPGADAPHRPVLSAD